MKREDEPRPVRLFTREEAEALLEELSQRLTQLRDAFAQLAGHHAQVTSVATSNGGDRKADKALSASHEITVQIKWLAETGIILRDPEKGLVDFPSEREGRLVFLCWQLGESGVDWWHDTDTGFSGRHPL